MRLVTWLAPGIPLAFYAALADELAACVDETVRLDSVTASSGPPRGGPEPFSTGEADLGAMCGPSVAWLLEREPSPIALLAAPVPADPESAGRPVYFSDVLVRDDHPAGRLDDLRGARWAYNDACSQSGYLGMVSRIGDPSAYFGSCAQAGSHTDAVSAVRSGAADVAAVDSTVAVDRAGLRRVERLGPFPIQPLVASAGLDDRIAGSVKGALLALHRSERGRRCLALAGYERFVESDAEVYRPLAYPLAAPGA